MLACQLQTLKYVYDVVDATSIDPYTNGKREVKLDPISVGLTPPQPTVSIYVHVHYKSIVCGRMTYVHTLRVHILIVQYRSTLNMPN